jgi:hypothetical protein
LSNFNNWACEHVALFQRASIFFVKNLLRKRMDCRVKPSRQGLARVDRLDQRALDADGERVLTLSGG